MKRSFWRGLISEAHDQTVCVTSGLSDHPMPVPVDSAYKIPDRIELISLSALPTAGGEAGTEDMATLILQMTGDYIIDEKLVVDVGHTLDFQEPFAPNIEMSAVLLALPFGVNSKRIMRCSRARQLLNVVPITAAELQLAREKDMGVLLDRFEEKQVEATFDCFRKSAV